MKYLGILQGKLCKVERETFYQKVVIKPQNNDKNEKSFLRLLSFVPPFGPRSATLRITACMSDKYL